MRKAKKQSLVRTTLKNSRPFLEKNPNFNRESFEAACLNAKDLDSLLFLEDSGGEPGIFMEDESDYYIGDCSSETPNGRKFIPYDAEHEAHCDEDWEGRNAVVEAEANGVNIMQFETHYKVVATLNPSLDSVTNSWVYTPPEARARGVAFEALRARNGLQLKEVKTTGPEANELKVRAYRAYVTIPKIKDPR